MKIQIINGVNLNLLGVQDPKLYGTKRFEPFVEELRQQYPDVQLDYFQSNSEGDIINKLHEVIFDYDGVIFNPGLFAFSSQPIAGTLTSAKAPIIEVHLLNPALVDPSQKPSLTAAGSLGVISGLGFAGYRYALESLLHPNK